MAHCHHRHVTEPNAGGRPATTETRRHCVLPCVYATPRRDLWATLVVLIWSHCSVTQGRTAVVRRTPGNILVRSNAWNQSPDLLHTSRLSRSDLASAVLVGMSTSLVLVSSLMTPSRYRGGPPIDWCTESGVTSLLRWHFRTSEDGASAVPRRR